MSCIGKKIIRFGIIGALAAGVAVAFVGPDRIGAAFKQMKSNVHRHIDDHITDPVALREQIRGLEAEYPARIGEVRSDLGELREQMAMIERDHAVSKRVVALADQDGAKLDSALAQAEMAIEQVVVSDRAPREVVIVFKDERLGVEEAYTKRNQIIATRNAYQNRVVDAERDIGYLKKQERQLVNLLSKLETEQTNFRTQLLDLDRQVDAIARNERMIEIMSKRQQTLDEQSRYRATSLDQLNGRLSDIRARQEAQMVSLSGSVESDTYEDRARAQLDSEALADDLYEQGLVQPRESSDEIEIDADESAEVSGESLAAGRR